MTECDCLLWSFNVIQHTDYCARISPEGTVYESNLTPGLAKFTKRIEVPLFVKSDVKDVVICAADGLVCILHSRKFLIPKEAWDL